RQDLIDRAANDYQRGRLTSALGAQMELTRDGMARHVAEQSLAWQRQVAQDRIALLTKEAALHHGDDALIDTLGHAAASAARAHARVGTGLPGGEPEDTAAATARSGVLGAAIQARLDRGDTQGANALLTQVRDQLDPAHAAPLQAQIDTIQPFAAAKSYPEGENGPPAQGADQSRLEYAAPPQPQISNGPSGGRILPVNHTPDDAATIPQGSSELAQAPAADSTQREPLDPAPNPTLPSNTDDSRAAPKPGQADNPSAVPADLSKLSEITSASEAYDHWLGGSGEPRQIPFEKIDTRSVQPEQFKVVEEKLREGKPGTYDIKGTTGFHADQSSLTKWLIGHITLGIEGTLVINDNGSYTFKGKLSALRDHYDMDAAGHRSPIGEFATTIGRQGGRVFGHKDYFVYFPGEKAISSPP
ncbi:MAG: lipid II-degrading bacteriocin, partial [Proteobacteria bacterium]|nr:lipid II-degrading bacteriocin [Pseudomonadota bacterium]